MRKLLLLAIRCYQRYLSPSKGFSCAYRVHTGGASCSAFGYRAIRRHGVIAGLILLDRRLALCSATYRRHHRPRVLSSQAGECDPGCDMGCSGSDACSSAGNCLDCADCLPDRKRRNEAVPEPLQPFQDPGRRRPRSLRGRSDSAKTAEKPVSAQAPSRLSIPCDAASCP